MPKFNAKSGIWIGYEKQQCLFYFERKQCLKKNNVLKNALKQNMKKNNILKNALEQEKHLNSLFLD